MHVIKSKGDETTTMKLVHTAPWSNLTTNEFAVKCQEKRVLPIAMLDLREPMVYRLAIVDQLLKSEEAGVLTH